MKLIHFFQCTLVHSLLFLLSLSGKSISVAKIVSRDVKIVGGQPCLITEHPYTVSIRFTLSYTHFCGGSLVNKFWVLTAAHCCLPKYRPGILSAYIGSSYLARSERQIILIISQVMHETYNDVLLIDDIALMELDYPAQQSPTVDFVNLPDTYSNTQEDIRKVCQSSTMMGWGDQYAKDSKGKPVSNTFPPFKDNLHCVRIPAITNEECSGRMKDSIPITIFCGFIKGKDTCQGDSGGPVMCNGVQYGIVSSGIGCAYQDNPGLYTRVDMYIDFIRNITGSSSTYKISILLKIYLWFSSIATIKTYF